MSEIEEKEIEYPVLTKESFEKAIKLLMSDEQWEKDLKREKEIAELKRILAKAYNLKRITVDEYFNACWTIDFNGIPAVYPKIAEKIKDL